MESITELPQRILHQVLYFLYQKEDLPTTSVVLSQSDLISATVVLSKPDRLSELPKHILQRILYFLTQEEAVRTSVLSKSWRYDWCTRPNLDFSGDTFKGNKQEFISIVNDNLRRYCDQRFSLEEFHLSLSLSDPDHDSVSVSLLEKWIPLFTIMGVKKFCLSIRLEYYTDRRVKLPPVAFGAESLQDLHVQRFTLDRKAIERMVLFKHLKKLALQRVCIEDEIFQKIISGCPSVETVFLDSCKGLRNIKVNNLCHLKRFAFCQMSFTEEECCIELYPPSLETINIEYGNISSHRGTEFCNLKVLYLRSVKSSLDHLSSCKFPSLKHLTLSGCDGLREIQLFIDAPNICYFSYRGNFIPSISFATTSGSWTSYIGLTYVPLDDGSSWFFKLNELLKSLSESRIYLTIIEHSMKYEDVIQENIHLVQDNSGGNKPAIVVESLDLECHLSSNISCFLNGVFSICRPRIIGAYYSHRWKMCHIKCLWKILMQRESGDEDDQYFRQYLWLRDLEEVRPEINERSRKGWHPITLSELPKYQGTEFDNKIRFALKWREPAAKIPRKWELEAWWGYIVLCTIIILIIVLLFFLSSCLLFDSFIG